MRPVLNRLRHQLRQLSWIAFVAIFGLALAPTISHALAHGQGDSAYTEICTPQGMKRLLLDASGAPASDPAPATAASHLDHCPLCGLGGQTPALPPAQPLLQPGDLGLSQALPTLFLQAPRPLFAWAAAQPRAPPLTA